MALSSVALLYVSDSKEALALKCAPAVSSNCTKMQEITVNNRTAVLQQVDQLLDRFGPFDNDDSLELLRQGLNAVFVPAGANLNDPPWVAFHAIYVGHDGKLTAVVEPLHIQEDIRQWCLEVAEYLGGRLAIEPEEDIDVKSLMAMRSAEGAA